MAKWFGLPSITSVLPNDVSQFLLSVKDTLTQIMTGTDRAVTISDLVNGNIATISASGTIAGTAAAIDYSIPPTPTGLTASGALTSIILQWTDPVYANLSYVEIWRANTDNQGLAVLVGQSVGLLFTDSVPPQSSYYYWIKFISQANVSGPFNAIAGVHGVTSADPTGLISLLTDSGVYTNAPYYYQAVPTTLNGVPVPVGTYMKSAFIADGSLTNAKIGNLQVDNAKIVSMAVDKLIAGSLAVGQYAQSTGFVSGSTGWRINGDGTAEFSGVTVRGNVQANSFSQITLTTGQHIKQGQTAFNTGTGFFLGDNGAGTPVFSLGVSGASGLTWDGTALTLNGSGTFNGTGTFSGALSAASGSFTGSLSGADITGATGTFGGLLTAGVVDVTKLIGTNTNYVTPGTYTLTVPADKTSMQLTLVGGGGHGGTGANANIGGKGGGGGGSGALVIATFSGLTPGATYTLVVGNSAQPTYVTGLATAAAGATGANATTTAGGVGGSGISGANNGGAGSSSATGNGTTGAGATGGSGGVYALASGIGSCGGGGGGGGFMGGVTAASGASIAAHSGGYGGYGYGAGGGGGSGYSSYTAYSCAGGAGAQGFARVEFFNPNGVVIRSEWSTLIAALTNQGIATA